jgi:hypothetical protein
MAEVQEVQEVAGQLRGALAAPRLHAHTLHSHSENHLDDGQGALFWSWDEASGNDGQSRGTKIIAGCEMVKLAKGTPETKCLLLQDRGGDVRVCRTPMADADVLLFLLRPLSAYSPS